eukprot:scaffold109543_cov25-Prasinocladus_malaysianus.AAC.1
MSFEALTLYNIVCNHELTLDSALFLPVECDCLNSIGICVNRKVHLSQEAFGRNLTAKVEDFEDFVSKLHRQVGLLRPKGGACAINNHFAPQTCLCGLPSGFQYDYIFKLEEQAGWYPGLIKLAGLDLYVKRGWGLDPSDVRAPLGTCPLSH